MKLYRYGMKLRGYSPGAQPKGAIRASDGDKEYWDIIEYDRKLTDEEVSDYELDYLGERRKCSAQENELER